ncbi:MAG: YHS domain-containing protein [Fidelibacterota bacterium]
MTKDPVCGMVVSEEQAAGTSTHMGKTYLFCSSLCKMKFDVDPSKYVEKEKEEGKIHSH